MPVWRRRRRWRRRIRRRRGFICALNELVVVSGAVIGPGVRIKARRYRRRRRRGLSFISEIERGWQSVALDRENRSVSLAVAKGSPHVYRIISRAFAAIEYLAPFPTFAHALVTTSTTIVCHFDLPVVVAEWGVAVRYFVAIWIRRGRGRRRAFAGVQSGLRLFEWGVE